MADTAAKPLVCVIMGSQSDWSTMKYACAMLDTFKIPNEARIISAHRTPARLWSFGFAAHTEGFKVIIAGAGGAAHLPGMTAALTHLPVFGVPCPSSSNALNDDAAIKSILMMPSGVPVGTLTIGKAGAENAALLAARVLALLDPDIEARVKEYIQRQTSSVAMAPQDEPQAAKT